MRGGKIVTIEYEIRTLNIDFIEIINHIETNGGILNDVYYQQRYVYYFTPHQEGRWIRLRSNGNVTTLTIKEIINNKIDGTQEEEIIVSDFEATNRILNKLGFISHGFQENFRIEYRLGEVTLDIDKWAMIPPLLEIEGRSKDDVYAIVNLLKIEHQKLTTIDIKTIFREKYNINLDSIPHLSFNEKELKEIENLLLNKYPHKIGILQR